MNAHVRFSASSIPRRCSSRRLLSHLWLLPLFALGLFAGSARAQSTIVLVGSGSSVPAPLYNRWTQEYGNHKSNVQMRYLTVGTSEGI